MVEFKCTRYGKTSHGLWQSIDTCFITVVIFNFLSFTVSDQLSSDSCVSGRVSIPLWSWMCCGASASSSVSACTLGFSFSHFAKPLFFPALPLNLDFILGKVWEPESFQPASCQSGSVCVAWLVVTLCSRTEIFREEPVTRVIALPSRSWCSAATLGNSNTSSWTGGRDGLLGREPWLLPTEVPLENFLHASTSRSLHCLWQLAPQ